MENQLKVTTISYLLSILIHLTFLSAPLFKESFFQKTYRVINVLPLSFDTKVESELLGKKSVVGNSEGISSPKPSSLTYGKCSTWHSQRLSKTQSLTSTSGDLKKFKSRGSIGNLGSFSLRSSKGEGNKLISLSVNVPKEKNSNRLPSISSSKLVPYLIRVRNKIMENWSPPTYTGSGSRKAIISLKIGNDGSIKEIKVVKFSSDIGFNRSVVKAIYSSEPFGKFPKEVDINQVNVKVNFEVR